MNENNFLIILFSKFYFITYIFDIIAMYKNFKTKKKICFIFLFTIKNDHNRFLIEQILRSSIIYKSCRTFS